jgi:hypothetical protein
MTCEIIISQDKKFFVNMEPIGLYFESVKSINVLFIQDLF